MTLGRSVGWLIDVKRLIRVDKQVYYVDHLPAHFRLTAIMAVVALSLAVALCATVPASREASRFQPVAAIRQE